MLKSAPDDFTDNVMQAVAKTSDSKSRVADFSFITYSAIILISVGASLGGIYYVNPGFFQEMFVFLSGFPLQIYQSFSTVFDGSLLWGPGFKINSIVLGVILIMAGLLAFDSFLGKRKKTMNLFV